MSLISFLGALELGFLFSLVSVGVYLSFRVLDFPDLTVDGSFPLGAAASAILLVSGVDPWTATLAAFITGAMAGLITAWLNIKLNILHLLASILVMLGLYSINLRIMGGPNIALLNVHTIFDDLSQWFGFIPELYSYVIFLGAIALLILLILTFLLKTQWGLALRAVGISPDMAASNGIQCSRYIIIGMMLSNGLVALAGSLFAQTQGVADVTMGMGIIVLGLASVIGGEALLNPKNIVRGLLACVVGALLYRMMISLALESGGAFIKAQDLNLVTAILVTIAIVLPRLRKAAH